MRRRRIQIAVAGVALAMVLGTGAAVAQQARVAPAASASQKSEATGIPECDKYFALVDACVATKKMTKEDQQAAELNVSRLRAMLPIARAPQGRTTLVDRCTMSLETAQKEDQYDCYKTPKKPAGRGR